MLCTFVWVRLWESKREFKKAVWYSPSPLMPVGEDRWNFTSNGNLGEKNTFQKRRGMILTDVVGFFFKLKFFESCIRTICLWQALVSVEYNEKITNKGMNRMIGICYLRNIKISSWSGLLDGSGDGREPCVLLDDILETVNNTEAFVVMMVRPGCRGCFDFFFVSFQAVFVHPYVPLRAFPTIFKCSHLYLSLSH